VWPILIVLLGAACRRADPLGPEIRNIVSAEKPPAYLEGVRWKLVGQIYEDRQYRPLWVGAGGVTERARDLIAELCDAEREGWKRRIRRAGMGVGKARQ
jgi:Scaffold domain